MGSWCATCGISRMPIQEDQQVKLLLIVKNNPQTGSSCYIDDWWKPVGLPVDAKYADYGNFELVNPDDINAQLLLDFLKDNVTPMEQGENKYHDLPVVPSELTWQRVNDLIHKGRLMLGKHEYFKTDNSLAWFPIHTKVYKSLVKPYYSWGIETEEHCNTTESTAQKIRDAVNRDVSERIQSIMEDIDYSLEDFDKIKDSSTMCFLLESEKHEILSRIFGPYSKMESFITEQSTDETILTAAEFIHMRASISQLRIPFNPVTGLGGQSDVDDYRAHQALAEAIKEQAQVYLDYYKELWGEDE